jgi:hypothetical protein
LFCYIFDLSTNKKQKSIKIITHEKAPHHAGHHRGFRQL